jgi:hypothetical protein
VVKGLSIPRLNLVSKIKENRYLKLNGSKIMHGVQIITPIKINTINLKNELDRCFIAKNKIVKKPKNKINSNLNFV